METTNTAIAARQTSISPGSLRALETCDELLKRKSPNFLRVVLNPWVAQTCLVLDHYARRLLRFSPGDRDSFCPSFLANSVDEALSGAVKLARFNAGAGSKVLVVDPENRFPHFGFSLRPDGTRVEYIPDVERCAEPTSAPADVGVLVVVGDPSQLVDSALDSVWANPRVLTITVANTSHVDQPRAENERSDIVVFDESFVNGVKCRSRHSLRGRNCMNHGCVADGRCFIRRRSSQTPSPRSTSCRVSLNAIQLPHRS